MRKAQKVGPSDLFSNIIKNPPKRRRSRTVHHSTRVHPDPADSSTELGVENREPGEFLQCGGGGVGRALAFGAAFKVANVATGQ